MNGRIAKKLKREARRMIAKEQEKFVPEFKKFVNTQLNLWERIKLAGRMLIRRF